MKEEEAGQVWEETLQEALEQKNTTMKEDDIKTLKGLSKLLGKVDIEGQLSEIELVSTFLEKQIELAEGEKQKNGKLYKTLGATLRNCDCSYFIVKVRRKTYEYRIII